MEVGVLMSATFETKYAEITIDIDDAHATYHGYIAVKFNPDGAKYGFFMEAYDQVIRDDIRTLFKTVPNYMVEKDIYIDDGNVMVNLSSVRDVKFGPDIVKIVKEYEKEYDEKVG